MSEESKENPQESSAAGVDLSSLSDLNFGPNWAGENAGKKGRYQDYEADSPKRGDRRKRGGPEAGIVERADVRNAVAVRARTLVERLHGVIVVTEVREIVRATIAAMGETIVADRVSGIWHHLLSRRWIWICIRRTRHLMPWSVA